MFRSNPQCNKINSEDKDNLFCFFSGYTNNSNRVISIKKNDRLGIVEISLNIHNQETFLIGEYIQLNGVICEVIAYNEKNITVSTTRELLSNTSLENITLGSKLNLGRLAEKEKDKKELYTLHPAPFGKAIFYKSSILANHQHTLKLDFICSDEHEIKEDNYIGLLGSSLTPKDVLNKNGKILFSIYCGKETRENTNFNGNLDIGTEVDIVAPYRKIKSNL